MEPSTVSNEQTSGDASKDPSPDSSRPQESPLNEMVETLADEDDEENADLAHAVGVDVVDQPLESQDDERQTE
jgi:hypothetical protein